MAGSAVCFPRRSAGGIHYGTVPYQVRHTRHSGRYSHTACPVLRESADHGQQGQSSCGRGQVSPGGIPAVCAGADAQQSPAGAAPHGCDRCDRSVLVLRHGAGLLHPGHRRQRQHGPGAGHQHERRCRTGSDALKRSGGPVRRSAGTVSGRSGCGYGPGRHCHRSGSRYHQ